MDTFYRRFFISIGTLYIIGAGFMLNTVVRWAAKPEWMNISSIVLIPLLIYFGIFRIKKGFHKGIESVPERKV